MDIVILNHPTSEVDVLKNVDFDFVDAFFAGDVEIYLADKGYNVDEIHYMCTDELVINENDFNY